MSHVRDLGRRPVRTALTILGIAIGIWALVVFGSMANKISALVEGGSTYYADKISLSDSAGSTGGFSAVPMAISKADDVRQIEGVAAVRPAVMVLMGDQGAITMGTPPMIDGAELGSDKGLDTFENHYAEGRALTADDASALVTVLGSDIARKYDMNGKASAIMLSLYSSACQTADMAVARVAARVAQGGTMYGGRHPPQIQPRPTEPE